MSQQDVSEPFGDSDWLLPLMEVQRRLYEFVPLLSSFLHRRSMLTTFVSRRSIDDPRAKIAREVLRLASSNAVFSKAFIEGRNGDSDSFQIGEPGFPRHLSRPALSLTPSFPPCLIDSIWNLISETSWVLNTIGDLLRTALLKRGWNTWNKNETTEGSFRFLDFFTNPLAHSSSLSSSQHPLR